MKRNTKWLATVGLSAGLLLGACNADEPVAESATDNIAFTVGDFEMTESEFTALMINQPMGGGYSYGERILEQEIVTQVLEMAYGDRVTDEMVEDALADMIDLYGGQDEYNNYMEREGFTNEQMKKETRSSLLFDEALFDAYPLEEEELKALHDNQIPLGTRVAHILVEDEDVAESLIEELADGADFAELVQKHSIDEGSLHTDGEYTIIPGQFEPAFEDASIALGEDEVTSSPVETPHGFHIIKSLNVGEKASFDESRDALRDQFYNDLFETGEAVYEQIIFDLIEEYESSISVSLTDLSGVVSRMLENNPANQPEYEAFGGEDIEFITAGEEGVDEYEFSLEDLEDMDAYEDEDFGNFEAVDGDTSDVDADTEDPDAETTNDD